MADAGGGVVGIVTGGALEVSIGVIDAGGPERGLPGSIRFSDARFEPGNAKVPAGA